MPRNGVPFYPKTSGQERIKRGKKIIPSFDGLPEHKVCKENIKYVQIFRNPQQPGLFRHSPTFPCFCNENSPEERKNFCLDTYPVLPLI